MRFVKGMIVGSAIMVGAAIIYSDGMMKPKKLAKKGRQLARRIGII